jgi:hypothetical protein
MDHVDAGKLGRQGLALAAGTRAGRCLSTVPAAVGRRQGGRLDRLGRSFGQCFDFVEEPTLARVRFAARPEHAGARQADLLVELEDAGLEGLGLLGQPCGELPGQLGGEGRLLRSQQRLQRGRIVRQHFRQYEAGRIRGRGVGGAAGGFEHAATLPRYAR